MGLPYCGAVVPYQTWCNCMAFDVIIQQADRPGAQVLLDGVQPAGVVHCEAAIARRPVLSRAQRQGRRLGQQQVAEGQEASGLTAARGGSAAPAQTGVATGPGACTGLWGCLHEPAAGPAIQYRNIALSCS